MDRRRSLSKQLRTTATQSTLVGGSGKRIYSGLHNAANKLDRLEKYVANVRRLADRLERENPELADELFTAIGEGLDRT